MDINELSRKALDCLSSVADTAAKCGKSGEVRLLAATKTRNKEEILSVINSGITLVGENRVQELTEKLAQGAYDGAELHFIGTLQANKAKYIVGKVVLIHSADRHNLSAISKSAVKAGIIQKILVEINIGGEEAKGGIAPDELEAFLREAAATEGIAVKGLMCIPPAGENPLPYFKQTKLLYDRYAGEYHFDTLSMGMSEDYKAAIECGSTIVRLGTAIFGARNYGTTK